MSAPPTADNTLLLPEGQKATLLPEQLLDFANEAFVFADLSRTGHAAKAEQGPRCYPAHPQAWFADVTPPPLALSHLKNTRVVPSREHILPLLPKGGVCVEINTRTGWFRTRNSVRAQAVQTAFVRPRFHCVRRFAFHCRD